MDVLGLEQRGFNAWPAPQSVYCDGWIFRLAGGYSKRANSANALGERGAGSTDALASSQDFARLRREAERVYAAHSQPTIFRLSPLAGAQADRELAATGYERFDACMVMTAPLDVSTTCPDVTLARAPTPAWLSGVAAAQGVAPSHRPIHERIVRAIAFPTAFATVFVGETAAGFGLGVAERGAVGLFDIAIPPEFRGRGLGRALTRALMRWGCGEGATRAWLQVSDDNIVARRLYAALGFSPAYPYHYRRRAL